MINLDHANIGVPQKKITSEKPISHKNLYLQIKKQIKYFLKIKDIDFLSVSQNASTSLAIILSKILKYKELPIYISSHEIVYFKELIETGSMPKDKVLRPNFAKLKEVKIKKQKVKIFEPEDLLKIPKGKKIIIISHVSRINGEIIFQESQFKKIKEKNKDTIIIVDACQSLGNIPVNSKKLADIILGVNSKFLGGIPHMGFCYINTKTLNYFHKEWDIDPEEFKNEIFMTHLSFKKNKFNPKKVSFLKKHLLKELNKKNIPYLRSKKQIDAFTLIKVRKDRIEKIVKKLEKAGIKTSGNTKWSNKEPKYPGIRISISARNEIGEIKTLIQQIEKIL